MQRLSPWIAGGLAAALIATTAVAQPPQRGSRAELRQYAQEIITAAVGDMGRLQQCQSQSTVDPALIGNRIRTVTIVIQPDGHIADFTASPRSLAPPALRTCVLDIARRWQLTPRSGTRPLRLQYTRALIRTVLGAP